MDPVGGSGDVVVNHALLDFVLDFSCESENEWTRFERRRVDRSALVALLPALAAVSKVTWMCTGLSVQYAALRLASFDLEAAALNLSARRKAKFVLEAFDRNVEIFSSSWKVDGDIPTQLRLSALGEVAAADLHQLRAILRSGFSHKIDVRAGDGQAASPKIWVTPKFR